MRRAIGSVLGTGSLLTVLALGGCAGGKTAPKAESELDVTGKVRLAQAYVNAGRVAEALATLDEAVVLEPRNASLHNFYGQVCFLAARYDRAEQAFLRTLELDSYLTDAHNNLGAVYDRTGRKDEAEAQFLLALKDPAYPTPEKVQLNLGLLYASQGLTDEAIERFRRAVEVNTKYYQAHFELASILDREDRLDEAAREYEVAAPAYQGQGDYHYRLGFTYMRLGEEAKARDHLGRVLELAPGSHSAVSADKLLRMMDSPQ